MEKERLIHDICYQYCSFYQQDKDEELACEGYSVLAKLLDKGKKLPAGTEKVMLGVRIEDELFRAVCRRCPFYEQDCDFAAWKRADTRNESREAVNPCGGFIALGQCLAKDTVDIEDLNRVM